MSTATRIALGYFVVVCVVIAVAAIIHATHGGPDASLAPVWAIAAALPGSLLVTVLPGIGMIGDFLLLVAVALAQSGLLYGAIRLFGRR